MREEKPLVGRTTSPPCPHSDAAGHPAGGLRHLALDRQDQQLQAQLSGEIASQQVHIERLQGAIKVVVNSELLFPSGGWQMPPEAAATIAKMAPILASQVQEHINVNGYTDNTPIGPELAQQGVTTNLILSQKRAEQW